MSSVGEGVGLKRPRSVVDPGSDWFILHKDKLLQGHCTSNASCSFCRVAVGFSSQVPSISRKITQTTIVLFSPVHLANNYLNLLTIVSSHISCAQSRLTPCDPLGCSSPGCAVYGISHYTE